MVHLEKPYSISLYQSHLQFLPSSPLSKLIGQKCQKEGKVSAGKPTTRMMWKPTQLLIFTLYLPSPVFMVETDQSPFLFPKDAAKCQFQLEFLPCSSRLQSQALIILIYPYVYKHKITSFFPHHLSNSSSINKKNPTNTTQKTPNKTKENPTLYKEQKSRKYSCFSPSITCRSWYFQYLDEITKGIEM